MSALCCAQAIALESAPNRSLFLFAQVAAPLVDTTLRWSGAPARTIALQSALYATSVLLPAFAVLFDPYYGSSAVNALIKTSAPLLCLLLRRDGSARLWIIALCSCFGFAIASFPTEFESGAIFAHIFISAGTLCGVLLGMSQKHDGACFYEMSLLSAALCLVTVSAFDWNFSIDVVARAFAHGVLSFFVQREVRLFATKVRHDAFALSMALNERRALNVLIGAINTKRPMRLLIGATVAFASAHYAVH